MSWSGGKDSALCLYHALRDPALRPAYLLTTLNEHYQRVAMHGVRAELLRAQAERIGLPLTEVWLPEMPSMETYEQRITEALQHLGGQGVRTSIFGDLHLADLRRYREEQVARIGWEARFPIWHKPAPELLAEFFDLGFRAIIVCVNEQHLDQSFCGRELDRDFLRDLPAGVDPCGENGEYHSFVYDAPYYSRPIAVQRGELVRRTYQPAAAAATDDDHSNDCYRQEPDPFSAAFWYCDLLPAPEPVAG